MESHGRPRMGSDRVPTRLPGSPAKDCTCWRGDRPPLERLVSGLAGSYAYSILYRHDPHLAVSDLPGTRGPDDRSRDSFDVRVLDEELEPELGQVVDLVLGTAVHLGVAALPAVPPGLGQRDPGDVELLQRFRHLLDLEVLDDGDDELHGCSPFASLTGTPVRVTALGVGTVPGSDS